MHCHPVHRVGSQELLSDKSKNNSFNFIRNDIIKGIIFFVDKMNTPLKKWLFSNDIKIIEVLRHSEGLKEKSFYDLVNRENPTLSKVLLFQKAVSTIKRRYVSLSEIYTGKKSKKRVDLSQWNLSILLKHKNIRQRAIADICGVGLYTVKTWKNNPSVIRIDSILKISEFLGIEIEDLFTNDFSSIGHSKEKRTVNSVKSKKIKLKPAEDNSSQPSQPEKNVARPKNLNYRKEIDLPGRVAIIRSSYSTKLANVDRIPEKMNKSLDNFISRHYFKNDAAS